MQIFLLITEIDWEDVNNEKKFLNSLRSVGLWPPSLRSKKFNFYENEFLDQKLLYKLLCSVTRQVSFNRTKIGGKCQNSKIQMRHFE